MESIRCGQCRRKLASAAPGAIAGLVIIKCPRCGAINHLRAESPAPERQAGTAGSPNDRAPPDKL